MFDERPLLLPDVREFGEILEYVAEWDHVQMNHRAGVLPDGGRHRPEPSYVLLHGPAHDTLRALVGVSGLEPDPPRAELGPYCSVDLSQLDGPRHRSIAVRATDTVRAALAPRLAVPGALSWKIIGHKGTGRALVIASYEQIIGSVWVAYVDPDTIPAYPFAERDAAHEALGARIRAATDWVPWRRDLPGGAADIGYDGWYPRGDTSARLERRGSLPHTRPVVVARIDAAGVTTFYPDGLEHLEHLERDHA